MKVRKEDRIKEGGKDSEGKNEGGKDNHGMKEGRTVKGRRDERP